MICFSKYQSTEIEKVRHQASLTLRAVELCVQYLRLDLSQSKTGLRSMSDSVSIGFGQKRSDELQARFICLGSQNQGCLICRMMCGDQKVAVDFACYQSNRMSLL